MQKHLDILKRYWGYDKFRELQGEIISSIAAGNDTLGLMPTGGGKSLTFQVPAMTMEGVCIVITPLVALMKDQVENLQKRGIAAEKIYSGLSNDEITRILDNTIYDAYKFLYVSPERLSTSLFLKKIVLANVCLLAVDESHCISQWGYDFRPSYLKIAEIRKLIPDVPILALTATATPDVVKDIQLQLDFKSPCVYQKSFQRSNLAYVVRKTEQKEEQLLKILHNVPGTSVVYVRNRKRTKELADFLNENQIKAENFHAGLSNEKKDVVQSGWKSGKTRVIVATNAFGMGIDKPDVRTVIHMDLPDSIEAYFQEAGRAGRDEKKSFAVLLFNNSDTTKVKKRISDTFPEKQAIRKIYEALCNYYQIGVGSGLDNTFAFDIADFCSKFKLPILIAYNALKIIQQAGYVELSDEQESSSSVIFCMQKDELYQVKNTPDQEKLIHILLRSYTGLFTDPTYINEELIAKRLNWKRKDVYDHLVVLSKSGMIRYIPRKKTPFITFTHERISANHLKLGKETYENRKERFEKKIMSMLQYAKEEHVCRNQLLLAYFGEKNSKPCGQCDICLKTEKKELRTELFTKNRDNILELLKNGSMSSDEIIRELNTDKNLLIQSIRFMLDNNEIIQNTDMKLIIKKA